jgi:hypothetical protein
MLHKGYFNPFFGIRAIDNIPIFAV